MSFKTWIQRAKISTWLLGNKDAVEAIKKAYEAGERSGRKQSPILLSPLDLLESPCGSKTEDTI